MNKYLTLIRDKYNVLIRIEERQTISKAKAAGKFYCPKDGWYLVIQPEDSTEVDMWYSLINM